MAPAEEHEDSCTHLLPGQARACIFLNDNCGLHPPALDCGARCLPLAKVGGPPAAIYQDSTKDASIGDAGIAVFVCNVTAGGIWLATGQTISHLPCDILTRQLSSQSKRQECVACFLIQRVWLTGSKTQASSTKVRSSNHGWEYILDGILQISNSTLAVHIRKSELA